VSVYCPNRHIILTRTWLGLAGLWQTLTASFRADGLGDWSGIWFNRSR
jgi:hypothetical protein